MFMKILALSLTAILLPACFPSDPAPPIGFMMKDQRVVARYPLCEGELVTRVRVSIADESTNDPEKFETIWEIVGRPGQELSSIDIGQLPDSFEQKTALSQPLPQDSLLNFSLDSTLKGHKLERGAGFKVIDLPERGIYHRGQIIWEAEFMTLRTCPSP